MQLIVTVVKLKGRADLMLRWTDPDSGRVRQKTAGTTRRREAERLAGQLQTDLEHGITVLPDRLRWSELRERFELEKIPSLSHWGGHSYASSCNVFERVARPGRVADITAARLSQFQAALRKDGLTEATIAKHLRHLKAMLRWGQTVGMVSKVPRFVMPRLRRTGKVMKGRPITPEEFERYEVAVETVVGADHAAWLFFVHGVWWSGLRVSEVLKVYWDRTDGLCIDLTGPRPMLFIPSEYDKGGQDRVHPIAPEFAELLETVPEQDRRGKVFDPRGYRGKQPRVDWVSRVGASIGREAGIVVAEYPRTGKVKYASLHDLRRSFGSRWAARVLPQQLQELMRRESIETTLKYYVGQDALRTAEVLWAAHERVIK